MTSASLDAAQGPAWSRRGAAQRRLIELARQYGRYGYRKIAELLRRAGWLINDKRVEWIWQRDGLGPQEPKRGRLWGRRTGAVPEGNSRNLLARIASNKTQVGVVHLRQLGVCMFWRRRYLSVSQVNCLRD